MKTKRYAAVFLAALCFTVFAGVAGADERVTGRVKSIDLDTKTVVVTSYEGQEVTITISAEDTLTLDKLRDKRIRVDDDVRVKYKSVDGKNVATYFKKPAGC
jgi:hypothetical protein